MLDIQDRHDQHFSPTLRRMLACSVCLLNIYLQILQILHFKKPVWAAGEALNLKAYGGG